MPTVNSLTLKEWMGEYERLKKRNADLFRSAKAGRETGGRKQ